MERNSSNSAVLQQAFSSVYREFFGRCSLVLSTSLSFNWIDDFSKRYRGVSITQKLPYKTYLGVEVTNDEQLEFGDLYQIYPQQGKHDLVSLKRAVYPVPEIREYLNRRLRQMDDGKKRGGRIHCLTELPIAHGYNFSGNFSALLSVMHLVLSERLNEEQVKQWEKFSPLELLRNTDSLFAEAFYAAWDLHYILKHGDSTGSGPFASLLSSYYPIISFPAKTVRFREFTEMRPNCFEGLGRVPFWGYRLNDLYKDLDSAPFWPVDMGVVFSGKSCEVARISQKINHDFNHYEDVQEHFRNLFAGDIEQAPLFPDFYENWVLTDETMGSSLYGPYGVLSLLLIRQLHCLLLHGYHEDEVDKFVATVGKRYFASLMMDDLSHYMGQFFLKLNSYLFQQKSFSRVGLFNTSNIQMGGGVGFVTGPQLNRVSLLEVFNEMNKVFPDMSLDYLSWLDGYGHSGITFEQDLSNGNYSGFIDTSAMLFCSHIGTKESCRFVNRDDLEDLAAEYDVLCNLVDGTVWIGGKPASGADLHSQKATLGLLSKLLEQKNEDVSCRDFPRSSYTQNKNEMQGKIILPLLRLIRDRTQRNLGLTCKGSNTDFFLKLSLKEDQKVGLIKPY